MQEIEGLQTYKDTFCCLLMHAYTCESSQIKSSNLVHCYRVYILKTSVLIQLCGNCLPLLRDHISLFTPQWLDIYGEQFVFDYSLKK